MTKYATGKKAFGFCDRCGFRYPLQDLKTEYANEVLTGLRTCPICYDEDHPQLRVGKSETVEAFALNNARPDSNLEESRKTFAWNPVGGPTTALVIEHGYVTVTIT